jgi:hypothetical protein
VIEVGSGSWKVVRGFGRFHGPFIYVVGHGLLRNGRGQSAYAAGAEVFVYFSGGDLVSCHMVARNVCHAISGSGSE